MSETPEPPEKTVTPPDVASVVAYCKEHCIVLVLRNDQEFHFYDIAEDQCQLIRAVAANSEPSSWFVCEPVPIASTAPILVSKAVLAEMNRQLKEDELSDVSKLAMKPVERTFVYFDVSDFTKQLPWQQVLIINSLKSLGKIDNSCPLGIDVSEVRFERSICIGDGFIFVFKKPGPAAFFAAYLAFLIERKSSPRFHFRAGIHSGPVYRFWDGADWNYIGDGINDGARVIEAIGPDQDDVLFMSSETRERITKEEPWSSFFNPTPENLHNRGRKKDKHNNFRRVYEVNHSAWIGKIAGADAIR